MKLIFEVTATPSLNKLKGHKWAWVNYKRRYKRELQGYELLALKKKVKCKMVITRYGSRLLDADNYAGACKILIDQIKNKGLIVDDSPKWLDISFEQVKCRRGMEKTVVEIERGNQ